MKWIALLSIASFIVFASGCDSVAFLIANTATLAGRYDRSIDHSYGPEARQKLDVYSPRGAKDRPVVVFFYGGSWQAGRRGLYRFVGAALAERGFIAVLPDYRLYPKVKFPDFVDDAAKAVAWVQEHVEEFGGDPRHIVLMGHSAGAHTAAFLALKPDFLIKAGANPDWIAGMVGLAGPYAIAPNNRALRTIFGKPYAAADYQPVRFVTPQAPPAFLAHGLDYHLVSVHQTEALRDALRRNDVRVETELYPDRGHADMVAAFSVPARHRAPVLDDAAKFIESVTGYQRFANRSVAATSSLVMPASNAE